jgi:hypothetical protein
MNGRMGGTLARFPPFLLCIFEGRSASAERVASRPTAWAEAGQVSCGGRYTLPPMKLYKQLADNLSVLIRQGALKPGDRVPSVRATSRERAGDKGSRRHRAIIDAAQEERLRLSCSG